MSEKEPQPIEDIARAEEMAYAEDPSQTYRIMLDKEAERQNELGESEEANDAVRLGAAAAERALRRESRDQRKYADRAAEMAGKEYDRRPADIEHAIRVIKDGRGGGGPLETIRRNMRGTLLPTSQGEAERMAHDFLRAQGIDSSPSGLARWEAEQAAKSDS